MGNTDAAAAAAAAVGGAAQVVQIHSAQTHIKHIHLVVW